METKVSHISPMVVLVGGLFNRDSSSGRCICRADHRGKHHGSQVNNLPRLLDHSVCSPGLEQRARLMSKAIRHLSTLDLYGRATPRATTQGDFVAALARASTIRPRPTVCNLGMPCAMVSYERRQVCAVVQQLGLP